MYSHILKKSTCWDLCITWGFVAYHLSIYWGDKYALLREGRGDVCSYLCRTRWMASLWSIRKATRQGGGGNVWSFGHASAEVQNAQEISARMVLCYFFREVRLLCTSLVFTFFPLCCYYISVTLVRLIFLFATFFSPCLSMSKLQPFPAHF